MKYERPELDILEFQVQSDIITSSDYVEGVTKPEVITPPGSF